MKALKNARVVVIGAGPAGISAATRLLENGFQNVLILEAESRLGGRIHTIPFGNNVIDLGAQWCHGEKDNVIYEMVKNLKVLDRTGTIYDDYKCIRSNKEIVAETIAEPLKQIAFESVVERQNDLADYEGSLGSYLTEKFWSEFKKLPKKIDRNIAAEFFENYKKFENSLEASDNLFEVSGKGHLEYQLCEGDLLLNWKEKGFKSFLQLLMKARPSNELGILNTRLLLNKRVEQVQWNQSKGIHIKCWNGEVIEADHVICTVSLGVLKENHQKMFSPALPLAKQRAIEGLKLGTVDKFYMEFERIFWPSDWPAACFLWCKEDLQELRNSDKFWLESVFGFFRVSHQPNVLQGWIIGAHARYMETLPEKEVLNGLLWLFRKFFSFPIPEPKNFLRTQWHSNPNFRGSYTFRSVYTEELGTGAWDLATPLTDDSGKPLLQFAGESTHDHFYSTVHGAVETGWREAQRLINFYERQRSHL